MVTHELPAITSPMLARIETICCKLPVKQLPSEHGVTIESGTGTCDGTPPRTRTAFGDSTLADSPGQEAELVVSDKYGRRLLADGSLIEEGGLLLLTSGDGVHLSREAVLDLAHELIRKCG